MEGIQFVINDDGEKTAVLIDLTKYSDLWEGFYDLITACMRANEPREFLESVNQARKSKFL